MSSDLKFKTINHITHDDTIYHCLLSTEERNTLIRILKRWNIHGVWSITNSIKKHKLTFSVVIRSLNLDISLNTDLSITTFISSFKPSCPACTCRSYRACTCIGAQPTLSWLFSLVSCGSSGAARTVSRALPLSWVRTCTSDQATCASTSQPLLSWRLHWSTLCDIAQLSTRSWSDPDVSWSCRLCRASSSYHNCRHYPYHLWSTALRVSSRVPARPCLASSASCCQQLVEQWAACRLPTS